MKKTVSGGIGAAFVVWLIIHAADFIDEKILDVESYFGFIMYLAVPLLMLVCYIVHNIRKKTGVKKLVTWFVSYGISCTMIWAAVYFAAEKDYYLIEQKDRSSFLNLNGIEYILYGFAVIVAFILLCILFHIVHAVIRITVKKFRKEK